MQYFTVKKFANDEFVEKKSKFIGYAAPVTTEQQAQDFIKQIKTKHWDATHNVYAYSIRSGNIERYSDDGEPQSTAGIPVLEVLRKKNITDTVVVVTRYFGGILLGGGGLVRAYTKGAVIAVEASEPVCRRECEVCRVCCDYNFYGKAVAAVVECGGTVDNSAFEQNVTVDFHIYIDDLTALKKKIADASCGAVQIERISSQFFDIKI